MVTRRQTIASALAVPLTLGSGCLGMITGSGTSFEAKTAAVSGSTADSTGYQYQGTSEMKIERTFEGGGQKRTVTAVNYLSLYEKKLSLPVLADQKAGVVAVLATPQVKVLGKNFNPVGDWSERKLARQLQSRYSSISIGDEVGSQNVSALGTSTEVVKFAGEATLNGGSSVDIYVHVTKFKHDGDYVVAIGVYPQKLDGEEDDVLSMIRNVEHPADVQVSTQSDVRAARRSI